MKTAIYKKFVMVAMAITPLVLSSCKKDSTSNEGNGKPLVTEVGKSAGEMSGTSIGSAGGTLNSVDGNVTVIIPAGALQSNTAISIQPITNEAPLSVGLGYRLLPEGTTFSKPVKITFHYNEQLLKQSLEDFLWIVTQAGDKSWNAMLKSVVDKNAKTVTIETTHFSDWALGKFIDFTLDPSAYSVKKGQSVHLTLRGFSRDKALSDNDELAPLPAISDLGDGLTPITPIPPVESRLMDFRVKQWTMNGATAPVSNSNGALNASGTSATYTAPGKKPAVNPVAVTVQLEANNKEGGKVSYMVTSNISVIETDLYLLVKIDGKTIEYYQYGFNGAIPPDPNNANLANCSGNSDGVVVIFGTSTVNGSTLTNSFVISIDKATVTTRLLKSGNANGNDNLTFMSEPGKSYEMDYLERIYDAAHATCNTTSKWGNNTVTVLKLEGAGGIIQGYFSGTIYEDKTGYDDNCKTPDAHTVEGEFNLLQIY